MWRLRTYLTGFALTCIGQMVSAQSAAEICANVEPDALRRSACTQDMERAAQKVQAYAQREGFVNKDGEYSIYRGFKAMLSWKLLIGLPPTDPYHVCAAAHGHDDFIDFRKVWACILEEDPTAIRMEAI